MTRKRLRKRSLLLVTAELRERSGWADEIVGEVVLTSDEIQEAVKKLGKKITEDYHDKNLLLVAILRGASVFLADLMREIHLPLEIDFISVSSYGHLTKSSGVVRIMKDLAAPVESKHVLVVEDVVDTGLTWAYLKQIIEARNPESVKICSLLDKPETRKVPVTVDYVGFTLENKFVVGYGLDWKDQYRNLPFIMVPKKHMK
ncbi:MAG: hypoxanthine phosphoribosyltransferase [Candidatus Hydrogenedentes bacterium CG07_land_8_20_14_0_80_42_17]|nr:MAG: hypoxanthine phosphoribosyltransferase [Candidatus Hydrogenedentes bacterium CG07_land_8_20_14_0_80_42_17]